MPDYIRRIFRNASFKNSMTLISGSMVAQLVTFLSSLLILRLYTPSDYGIYAIVLAAESIFGGIVCGRYDFALVYAKSEGKMFALVKLSLYLSAALSLLFGLTYSLYYFVCTATYRSYWFSTPLVVLLLFSNGLIRLAEAFNNRSGAYGLIAKAHLYRTAVQNALTIAAGFAGFGFLGLALAHTIGGLFGLRMQGKELIQHRDAIMSVDRRQLKAVAREFYRQPLYSAPSVVANRLSYSSITLFMERLFGAASLGQYSLSYKVLGLPLAVISNNLGKVFFRDAVKEYNRTGGYQKTFRKSWMLLLPLTILMYLGLTFIMPGVVTFLYGGTWQLAGEYIAILALMFSIRFMSGSLMFSFQIVSKQRVELIFQLFLIGVAVLAFFLTSAYGWDSKLFLHTINIGFSIVYFGAFLSIGFYSQPDRRK